MSRRQEQMEKKKIEADAAKAAENMKALELETLRSLADNLQRENQKMERELGRSVAIVRDIAGRLNRGAEALGILSCGAEFASAEKAREFARKELHEITKTEIVQFLF